MGETKRTLTRRGAAPQASTCTYCQREIGWAHSCIIDEPTRAMQAIEGMAEAISWAWDGALSLLLDEAWLEAARGR